MKIQLIILALISVGFYSVAAAEELCVQLSEECVGKRVRLMGTIPKHVLQHPSIHKEDAEIDRHLDINGRQIVVVVSKEHIRNCSNETTEDPVEVIGTLRRIDLGGEPGTKDSYSNYYVEAESFKCKS